MLHFVGASTHDRSRVTSGPQPSYAAHTSAGDAGCTVVGGGAGYAAGAESGSETNATTLIYAAPS